MATIAALAIGAGSAIAGGIAGSKQAQEQKENAEAQMRLQRQLHAEGTAERTATSKAAQSDQDFARQSLVASEQTKMNLLSSLGQPGTYGPGPGSTTGPIQLSPMGLESFKLNAPGTGVLSGTQLKAGGTEMSGFAGRTSQKHWESTGNVTDPNAVADSIKGTSAFRSVSAMVAEAEQLMNRTGPLWDQLNNSVVGSIYESNAGFQRDAMEQLARSMARGGSARRQGLQMAQAFQIQEKVNRQRTQQLWSAKLGIEKYRTEYAQDVTTYAQNWVNNHAGIRDRYVGGLTDLQTMWSQTLAPALVGASVGAASSTQQGVLQAGQGLSDAINVRGQAIGGALEGVMGSLTKAYGTYDNSSGGGGTIAGSGVQLGGPNQNNSSFMDVGG